MGTVTRIGLVLQDAMDQENVDLPDWQIEIIISGYGAYPDPLTMLLLLEERVQNEQDSTNH
jgi:hypothetical protein